MFIHRCVPCNSRQNAVKCSTTKTVLYSRHSFDICQKITLGIYFSCSLYAYIAESLYKSKDVLVHAVMACRASTGIAPLIINVSIVRSSLVSFIAWPVCTQGKSMQYQLCTFSRRLPGPQTWCRCSKENIPWPLL